MLQNYAKSTLRYIQRYKGYALLNIMGLAFGIACGLLILAFVHVERSYDRFHTQADSIYRLLDEQERGASTRISTSMPPPLAAALVADIPEIEDAVRLWKRDNVLFAKEGAQPVRSYEDGLLYADSTFFSFFSFPLLRGDPEQVLNEPRTLVLTASLAAKYFGSNDPVGETLKLTIRGDVYPFTVSGVMADPPTTSSIQFRVVTSFASAATIASEKFLLDFGWRAAPYPTFVRLREGTAAAAIEAKIATAMQLYVGEESVASTGYSLEALTDVYLHGRTMNPLGDQGSRSYVLIFLSIAVGILLIASINYMTLATARAERRAREVGVRKAVGARRGQLALQFLGESVVFCGVSAVLALGLMYFSLPLFNTLVGKTLVLEPFLNATSLAWFGGAVLLLGLLAGSYPALLLSHFRPTDVLRGTWRIGTRGSTLRKTLVTVQFALSAVLIVSTFIIYQQLAYLHGKDLGYNHESVIAVYLWDTPAYEQPEVLKNALEQLAVVEHVALSTAIPTKNIPRIQMDTGAEAPAVSSLMFGVDADFLDTFGLRLAEGHNFSHGAEAPSSPVVLNQQAVAHLGLEHPVGQTLTIRKRERTVVGVIEDFHLLSLHDAIEPMLLVPTSRPSYLSIRLREGDLSQALDQVADTWAVLAPDYPFSFIFLDDAIAQMYSAEERLAEVFYVFAVIAIGIAVLGLFGLAAYTAEQRTKEVCIRKVFGASTGRIMRLLVRDFLKLTALAFVIAAPLAYYGVEVWLRNFAYRTEPGIVLFVTAGGVLMLVTLLTVAYQTYRAARTNPAHALQSD
ncbi:MAG: ABC transporter permease [Rhodothermales bacterium]